MMRIQNEIIMELAYGKLIYLICKKNENKNIEHDDKKI